MSPVYILRLTCCHSSDHIAAGSAVTSSCRHCSACRRICLPFIPPSLVSWFGMHICLITPARHLTTVSSQMVPGSCLTVSAVHVCLMLEMRLVSSCSAASLVPYAVSTLVIKLLHRAGTSLGVSRACSTLQHASAWPCSWTSWTKLFSSSSIACKIHQAAVSRPLARSFSQAHMLNAHCSSADSACKAIPVQL